MRGAGAAARRDILNALANRSTEKIYMYHIQHSSEFERNIALYIYIYYLFDVDSEYIEFEKIYIHAEKHFKD